MANLNLVKADVSIAGTQVNFKRLQLTQQFNAHHTCEIEIDYEELDKRWMSDPIKFIKFIGEDINITFQHRQTGEQNLFAGVVTNVSFSGYHGNQNSIIITGASPTIKLDGKPAMDSFMDLPLLNIVQEAVANSGNGGSVIANPIFKSKLDYVCQYNQSCWEFLNYLSWITGEWLFYNGQNTYFGFKNGETVTLEYDKEMTYFDLSANLVPSKFNRRHYLKHDDKTIDQDDPSFLPGVHGYLQVSKKQSEKIYTSDVTTPLLADINVKKDLDDLVKAEKSRAVAEMLVMRGKTQTCKVKIGGSVKVQLPEYMKVNQSVDRFLVTQVTHTIDQEGHYSNSFEGIIDEMENVPMAEPKIPMAFPQIARVKANVEPRGRGLIKVQTDWQKVKNKTTNWIRVQSLDAGTSGVYVKNRGHVYLPEIDDIVMLGFEYGDPSRPYVAGSIFSELVSEGGKIDNHLKSTRTRTGLAMEYNDDMSGAWGITIRDKKGDLFHIDTKGENILITANKNITISAGETMTLNARNLNINVRENMSTSVGNNQQTDVGKSKTLKVAEAIDISATDKKEVIDKNNTVTVGKKTSYNSGDIRILSTEKDIVIKSIGKALLQGANDARISKG